jgi:peroxiredoxin
VLAVSERHDDFGDAEIAVVTFTEPGRLDGYVDHLGLSFPVVSDVDRSLYRALGIERGTLRAVWSLGTLRQYARLLRRGRRLRRTTEDTRQLGADLVVDADGRIVRVFRPPTPDARPGIDELVAALRAARAAPG